MNLVVLDMVMRGAGIGFIAASPNKCTCSFAVDKVMIKESYYYYSVSATSGGHSATLTSGFDLQHGVSFFLL